MSALGSISDGARKHQNPFDAEMIADLRAHPRFPQLALRIAQNFVDQFDGNRFLNLISNDRGRMQVGHAVLYLHYMRDPRDLASGLTPSRLKAFCSQHGMCSPGRTAAMLAVMQMAGHVVEAPAVKDRRFRLLMPTEKLRNTFRDRWIVSFDALAELKPGAMNIAQAAREREDFAQNYIPAVMHDYIAGHRPVRQTPELDSFADANAGLLIFLNLFASGSDGNPVQVPVSGLARRFGVSRPHVKQVLRSAQENAMISISSDGSIKLSPRMIDAAHKLFSTMLAFEWNCGRRALEAANSAAKE